jgi:hypothetical protein
MAVVDPTSERRAPHVRAALADLRAALRRGHEHYHRLEKLEVTGDLSAEQVGVLTSWRSERARLRDELARAGREYAVATGGRPPPGA